MLNFKYEPITTYDAVNKIWFGESEKVFYDENVSIGEIIYEQMHRNPKKVCLISHTEQIQLTNEELLLHSIQVAQFLRNEGITQRDVVGLVARNTTHLIAVAYGCFFNGTPFHALNPIYDEATSSHLFAITKPKIVFCDAQDYQKTKNATQEYNSEIYTLKEQIKSVSSIFDIFKTPVDKHLFRPTSLENGVEQILAILCSSGSTGRPKAVPISNARRIFNSFNYLTSEDVQYVASTLDWLSGLLALICNGVFGTLRIVTDEPYDPEKFLELATKYKITWTVHAPSHMAMLLNSTKLTAEKLDSVRYFIYGGGLVTVTTQQKMQSYLRNGITQTMYGFTEFGAGVSSHYRFDKKPKSVGRLYAGIKTKIIDESGVHLGPGKVGEICCHNGQYWCGYYGNEEATKDMRDSEGWLHTGDLGYFDKDNYLFIVDRKKDMLKYFSIMYYPHDIEELIMRMPNVAEVCVFGVWNQLEGDAAAACVVKKSGCELTAEEVVDYVKEHTEVKYKQLNAGALIVDNLERTANGKVNRLGNKSTFLKSMNKRQSSPEV